jgi:hypothetical protein
LGPAFVVGGWSGSRGRSGLELRRHVSMVRSVAQLDMGE